MYTCIHVNICTYIFHRRIFCFFREMDAFHLREGFVFLLVAGMAHDHTHPNITRQDVCLYIWILSEANCIPGNETIHITCLQDMCLHHVSFPKKLHAFLFNKTRSIIKMSPFWCICLRISSTKAQVFIRKRYTAW